MQIFAERIRQGLVGLSTPAKRAIALSVDLLIIPLALWLAFLARLGPERMIDPAQYYWLFLAAIGTAIPVFIRFGMYRAVLRYMGRDAITSIFSAVSLAALLLALVIYWTRSELLIPRLLVVNYWVIVGLLIGITRFAARAFLVPDQRLHLFSRKSASARALDGRRRVAIYGAGAAGFQLFRSLQHDRDILPVAFIDDDRSLQGRSIGGLQVYAPERITKLIEETATREVFLALPSITPVRRREILEGLEPHPLYLRSVPTVYELTTGRKELSQLQDVRVEDLLGRNVVPPLPHLLEHCIRNESVMITGAGGSIGSELCRQIVDLKPTQLILFDHSEFNLFRIEEEIRRDIARRNIELELVCILGSVTNKAQIRRTIAAYRVKTIYHAAAYKHVSIVEQNIAAGIRNNVFGTLYTALSAIEAGVQNFVLISTDKAVKPSSAMGASKRLAELVLQGLSAPETQSRYWPKGGALPQTKHHTRFTMVRFGNVVGSSGSVIPKFRRQIQEGVPVTVTHPDVTRYFMTIPEAAQLVIQAGSMGTGGDIFVLDMGQPVRILDLATKIIRLSGLSVRNDKNPHGDIEIVFSGLQPGEKVHEEPLLNKSVLPTGHPMIFRTEQNKVEWEPTNEILDQLQLALDADDQPALRNLLGEIINEPQFGSEPPQPAPRAKPESLVKAEVLTLKPDSPAHGRTTN